MDPNRYSYIYIYPRFRIHKCYGCYLIIHMYHPSMCGDDWMIGWSDSEWDDHKPSMFFNKTIIHDRIIYIYIIYEHIHHHYIILYHIGDDHNPWAGTPVRTEGVPDFLELWIWGLVIRRWGPEKPLKHWFKPGVWLGLDQSKLWFHLWFGKDTLW